MAIKLIPSQRTVHHYTALSRESPLHVRVVVKLCEEGFERREGVFRALRPALQFCGELWQVRAKRGGPRVRRGRHRDFHLTRARFSQSSRQSRYIPHGESQSGDFSEFLARYRGPGYGCRWDGLAESLEGPVDLSHAAPFASVGRFSSVLAERLRRPARARLAAARGPRPQLVLVVVGHRVRGALDAGASAARARIPLEKYALRPLTPLRSSTIANNFNAVNETVVYLTIGKLLVNETDYWSLGSRVRSLVGANIYDKYSCNDIL